MNIDKGMNAYEVAQAIYYRQLEDGNGSIDKTRYYWKLGENVHKQLKKIPLICESGDNYTADTMFGIVIRFDMINPDNLQLFKDVTR